MMLRSYGLFLFQFWLAEGLSRISDTLIWRIFLYKVDGMGVSGWLDMGISLREACES